MLETISTPFILIDADRVRANVRQMARYASEHRLALRPHTKTHKSIRLGAMQIENGAIGLTVAKPGEAQVMADATDDILMAYPAVDPHGCAALAALAREKTIRVGMDSAIAADALASACRSAGVVIGALVDLDVGHHRTGVQSAQDALALAQHIDRTDGLRLDGLIFFPGHIAGAPGEQAAALRAVDAMLGEVLGLFQQHGLEAKIVSGGSTPTAMSSHLVRHQTEIRPGTYIFNDMNCVHGKSATLNDCAARIIATVVSTAVPGQVVVDAGTKTLTSDRCGPAPDSGHGYVVEFPEAKIVKLNEEHGQIDVRQCSRPPLVGQRVSIIPNHICPCINLQDSFWWQEPGAASVELRVDARGRSR